MTNPLSPDEREACWNALTGCPWSASLDPTKYTETVWASALDYLRAELAKEEPVCHRFNIGGQWFTATTKEQCEKSIKDVGIPATIEPLYLRPSEPSKEVSEVWALANKSVVLLFATKADADIFQKANRMDTASLYLMPQRMPVLKCDEPSTSKEKDHD